MSAGAGVEGRVVAPSWLKVWWLAIRPKTLSASVVPVALGTALAGASQHFDPVMALAALFGAILLQVSSNLANDLFDFIKGADTDARLGPARAAQKGWLTVRQLAWGTALSVLLAVAAGAVLIAQAGWPIVVVGVTGIACAIGYTAGPRPLGYLGLGDVLVFMFFGPVAVCGTYYVQAGILPWPIIVASVPVGTLATAILVVNNLRDRRTDALVGKRTLVVRFGARFARLQYAFCLGVAYLVPPLVVCVELQTVTALLPCLSLPFALALVRAVWMRDGEALNPLLGATAQLGLVFGLLWSLGVLL